MSQRLSVIVGNSHTQLTNLQYVYDRVSFNTTVLLIGAKGLTVDRVAYNSPEQSVFSVELISSGYSD